MIPPTEQNLEIFEQWALSPHQTDEFFGDLVDKCYRVHLVAGDTFMIPTGMSCSRLISWTKLLSAIAKTNYVKLKFFIN